MVSWWRESSQDQFGDVFGNFANLQSLLEVLL